MTTNPNVPSQFAKASKIHLRILIAALGLILIAGSYWWMPSTGKSAAATNTVKAIAVDTASTTETDMPIYLEGLGTVQAFYTVTVTARVDGQLQKVGFIEGQTVHKGDFLAQIDPRPARAALELAIAAKAKDEAQLLNAKHDLDRYVMLAPQNLSSKQTLDTQRALVAQLEAQTKGDQATIDNAKTQLDYTTITSPIQGRTGIRLVDPGNNVHASDTTGIVVVTQLHPISVIFTLPEDAFLAVNNAMTAGPVSVAAMSRDGKTELDHGIVALIDNQIDQTTGTIRLKATFPNARNTLWPGEFVNIRLLEKIEHNALSVPSVAIQRGPNGTFVYVVKANSTLEMRPVTTGEESGASTVVESGIHSGERVVTSNQYLLQPGALIRMSEASKKDLSAVTNRSP
jgi:multidrug efflux system membrane fusion protein